MQAHVAMTTLKDKPKVHFPVTADDFDVNEGFESIRSAASLALERIMGPEDAAGLQRSTTNFQDKAKEEKTKEENSVEKKGEVALDTKQGEDLAIRQCQPGARPQPAAKPRYRLVNRAKKKQEHERSWGPLPILPKKVPPPPPPPPPPKPVRPVHDCSKTIAKSQVSSSRVLLPLGKPYNLVEDVLNLWQQEFEDAPLGLPPPQREIPQGVVLMAINKAKQKTQVTTELDKATQERENEKAVADLLDQLQDRVRDGGPLTWQQFQEIMTVLAKPVMVEDVLHVAGRPATTVGKERLQTSQHKTKNELFLSKVGC